MPILTTARHTVCMDISEGCSAEQQKFCMLMGCCFDGSIIQLMILILLGLKILKKVLTAQFKLLQLLFFNTSAFDTEDIILDIEDKMISL